MITMLHNRVRNRPIYDRLQMNDAEEAVCDMILKERYLFGVCWSQSQIIQAVWGHVPNSIEEPGVSDCFHTQLPRQEMRHRYFFLC